MHSNKTFPDLTYEEYIHAVCHIGLRIQKMIQYGSVAIDQLVVKWYITRVLKINTADRKLTAAAHHKYIGAIQKMIADGLVGILEADWIGKQHFRALHIHPQFCPAALWLAENGKARTPILSKERTSR